MSIKTVLSLASNMKWKLHQMNVNTTFLNGLIEEEVYSEQPQVFETDDQEAYVCKLKKALYGLKQEPRAWYGRIDGFLTILGFTKSKAYSNLYYKIEGDGLMILLLYVDYLLLAGKDDPIN